MENMLLEAAVSQGIWVLLFVSLFLYTIKNSEKREQKYQELLEGMTQKYDLLLEIKSDVEDIKENMSMEK